MRRQYSKREFRHIAENTALPQSVRERMDDAYAGILYESENQPMNKAILRPIRRTVLIAICLCLLVTGALAAYLSTNTDFFLTVFGRESLDAVTEYDETGAITKNLPTMERTVVDEQQADALVGAYMEPAAEPYSLQTHMGPLTVEILGNAYDSATGTGVVAFTLERQSGGFPELVALDAGAAYFDGKGLRLNVANGEAMYYDRTQSTENKAFFSVSYVQLTEAAPVFNLFEAIPLSDVDPSELTPENEYEDVAIFDLLNLSLAQTQEMPSTAARNGAQDAVYLSSIGMKLDLNALGLYNGADDFDVKTMSIAFQDGSEYQVMDRDGRIVNYEYALIPEDGTFATYCFNRPVDISQIQHVKVNDLTLTIE